MLSTLVCCWLVLWPPPALAVPCSCPSARLKNGWCRACRVGYVAGVRLIYPDLFEALDAHGHIIKPESMTCASCKVALLSDGFCDRCNWGFVNRQLYFSRLTYLLARGQPTDTATLSCTDCRKNAAHHGWCGRCSVGMVGNFAYTNERVYSQAATEYRRLLRAVDTARHCEVCAIILFTEGQCPEHAPAVERGNRNKTAPDTGSEDRRIRGSKGDG